jgi:hypothetical protein
MTSSDYLTEPKTRYIKNITHCPICKTRLKISDGTYDSAWIVYRKRKGNKN